MTKSITDILKSGGVGVLPTDTLYGIVGSALSKKSVARIYCLRKRDPEKPMIVLLGSPDDLKIFGVKTDEAMREVLLKVWPGKVSVILPCSYKKFKYLHRETNTIAFRVPDHLSLRRLLKETGPLVAPSANLEGMPPATCITEARKYFGNAVDFYHSRGKIGGSPSTVIACRNGRWEVIRQGPPKFLRNLLCLVK